MPPAGATTGQPGFAAGKMRPNGSKGRGGNGSRVWEKRKAPAFAGPMTGQRGFAAGEMEPNGDKRRGFAVGDPARRSRDGTAKERCGAAKP